MNSKTIKIINSSVVIVTMVAVIISGIFVLLNWPAFLQRIKNVSYLDQKVEAKEELNTEKPILSDNIVMADYRSFPDFFVDEKDVLMAKEYQDKLADNSMIIPKLQIAAPIQYLDTTEDEIMRIKLKEGVVHYPKTAMPGQKGNVFIFGHSSSYWWDWSDYSTIFASLENIKVGDEIIVKYQGKIWIYRTKSTKVVESNDFSVLEQGNNYRLTLMTCTPLGTDLRRFIVEAELVN